jgi:4-hydroxybenzoate polyprenyltransferase
MVLNDVFDRHIDAKERPKRPIPSGRVSLTNAVRLAVALLVIGNVAAWCAGLTSGVIAALLTGCILAYDGGLKNTLLGPVVMGSCRFLNILLGASAVGSLSQVFQVPQLPVAIGMGVYIVGVTIFSRQEAETSVRWKLALGVGVVNLGFAVLAAFMLNFPSPVGRAGALGIAAVMAVVDGRLFGCLVIPSPQRVQAAVRTMLMSLVTLNALVIFHATGTPMLAAVVMAMLLPAMYLGRFMTIT